MGAKQTSPNPAKIAANDPNRALARTDDLLTEQSKCALSSDRFGAA